MNETKDWLFAWRTVSFRLSDICPDGKKTASCATATILQNQPEGYSKTGELSESYQFLFSKKRDENEKGFLGTQRMETAVSLPIAVQKLPSQKRLSIDYSSAKYARQMLLLFAKSRKRFYDILKLCTEIAYIFECNAAVLKQPNNIIRHILLAKFKSDTGTPFIFFDPLVQ